MKFQTIYASLAIVLALTACTPVGQPIPNELEGEGYDWFGDESTQGATCGSYPQVSFVGGNNGSTCSTDDCGSNTPVVNGYHVDELFLPSAGPGLPNHDNMRIAGFIDPWGYQATLQADEGQLSAFTQIGPIRGPDLVGSKIIVENTVTLEQIVIVIFDYKEEPSWVDGSLVPVRNYLLTYSPKGGSVSDPWCRFTTPICDIGASSGNDLLTWAVVLTKERYQHDTDGNVLPNVTVSPAHQWFDIACQGSALNKARRMEYFPDSPAVVPDTTVEQRETAVKSIVASYCDNGNFTEDGTPVAWRNRSGSVDTTALYEDVDTELEAIWSHTGALCINHDALRVPDLAFDVAIACPGLWAAPECTDVLAIDPLLEFTAEMVTYVPVPAAP